MRIQGTWFGKLKYPDGRVEWMPAQRNLIVASASKFLAAGCSNQTHTLYHALGVGDAGWDFEIPPASKDDTTLFDEVFRKAVTSATYITEYTGLNEEESPQDQDKLQSTVFGPLGSLLVGHLCEIIAGTGAGDVREITAYSSPDQITVSSNFSAVPDNTTKFRVAATSSTETSVVEFETDFLANDSAANSSFREEAIFGGSATQETDSGVMLNVLRSPIFTKTSGVELTRVVRVDFNEVN